MGASANDDDGRLQTGQKVFTASELSAYDGNDGAPEYIAINGTVYDITNFNLLKSGKHHGVTGGRDVTDIFVHKPAILKRLPVVGILE
jgi:predicted heme/steroid binding protein